MVDDCVLYVIETYFRSNVMRNENLVFLVGNLTKDPELRSVKVGDKNVPVVNVRLAVSDEYRTANGTSNKITTYINCEAWDTAAERISENLKKGDPVFIRGSLRPDEWKNGETKFTSLKVRINSYSPLVRSKKGQPVAVAAESEDSEIGENVPF